MYTLDFFFLCAISFLCFVPVHGRDAIHRPKNKNTYFYFFLCFVSAHGRDAIRRPKNKKHLLLSFVPLRSTKAPTFRGRFLCSLRYRVARLFPLAQMSAFACKQGRATCTIQNYTKCKLLYNARFCIQQNLSALVQNCTFCAILNSFWCCACLQFVVFVGVVLCSFLALSFASFLSRASKWQSHP